MKISVATKHINWVTQGAAGVAVTSMSHVGKPSNLSNVIDTNFESLSCDYFILVIDATTHDNKLVFKFT